MSKIIDLGTLSAAGPGATKTMDTSPFQPRVSVKAFIMDNSVGGSVSIEGSDDGGSTWTDVIAAASGSNIQEVVLKEQMRANVAAITSGSMKIGLMI